jgi:hypothetical protein
MASHPRVIEQFGQHLFAGNPDRTINLVGSRPLRIVIEQHQVALDNIRAMLFGRAIQGRQGRLRQYVVGIEEQDVFAPGQIEATVARDADAGIFIAFEENKPVGVSCREAAAAFEAVVGRCVVDQDNFAGAVKILVDQALQTLVDIAGDVEHRSDDRYQGRAVAGFVHVDTTR